MSGATPTRIPSGMTSANGVDDAGNAVGDAVDDAGNAIRDGADAVTGDNNNAAKQPNTANGTNAPAENP